MKKSFLLALIVAGTTASFGQAQNTNKPVTRNTAPNLRQSEAAKMNPQANQAAGTNTKVSAPNTKATQAKATPTSTNAAKSK